MSARHVSAATAATAAAGHEQYLTFELAGEHFALPILAVREIRGWEPVAKLPQSVDYVLGVIDLRGEVVPVIDLRARLGIARCETTATTVVIVVRLDSPALGSLVVGCVVDAVSDVANVDPAIVSPAPSVCGSTATGLVRGLAAIDGRLVMLLDLDRLIEQRVLDEAARAA